MKTPRRMTVTRVCTTELHYKGRRFAGAKLPIDVLEDLPALRDLIVIFAKEAWLTANPSRKRIPRNLIDGLQVSLTKIEDGSALPQLQWEFPSPQTEAPEIATEPEEFVKNGYAHFADAIRARKIPEMRQPSNRNRALYALRRFGKNLKPGEEIGLASEFSGKAKTDENVIYWNEAAKAAVERSISGSYTKRLEFESAEYLGGSVDERKTKATLKFNIPSYNRIEVDVPYNQFITDFYPYLHRQFFLDLDAELDGADRILTVQALHDYERQQHPFTHEIEKYRDLQDGWLEGHGKAVAELAIEAALTYLDGRAPIPSFYGAAATEEGGILLEYRIGTWDYGIEFLPSGEIEFFGVDHDSDRDLDQTVQPGGWDILQKIVEGTLIVGAISS